jgi:8-hydroxy-5-deazaflavin:NADPH oxidoreductase
LNDEVVVDPTNPIELVKLDGNSAWVRSLPEGQSSCSVVAGLLRPEAHYVKAFGTLSATTLASSANRLLRRAVLFYATNDARAAATMSGSSRQPGLTR